MIAADERYPVGIPDFEAKKKQKGLEGVETAVNEVACFLLALPSIDMSWRELTHEQVVGIRYVATHTEKLHKIMELTMDVATDCYRSVDVRHIPARASAGFLPLFLSREDIPFFQQNLPSLVADFLHLIILSARVRAFEGHRKCACAVCHIKHLHPPPVWVDMLGAALCVCPSHSSFTPRPAALQYLPAPYLFASDESLNVACRGVVTGRGGVSLGRSCRSRLVYTRRFDRGVWND